MNTDFFHPKVIYQPGGFSRPDGTAWPTREQIFAELDRTLSPFDKAEVQRCSEEDVMGCKLCGIGMEIRHFIFEPANVEDRKLQDPLVFLVHPDFNQRPCVRSCVGRECPKGVSRPAFGIQLEDGVYDLAMEYREYLRALSVIKLSPEPPALPPEEHETWIHYERGTGEKEYSRIILDPPAVQHLTWSCQVKKQDSSLNLEANHNAFKRWFACLAPDERTAAFAACKGIASESLPAHIIRGTIELHGPDGSTEKLKGVPIPRVCFWIDDHRKWWDWERCFLACLISLFEWTGEAASCQWYEGWKNALQIVEDFLFRGMPEPNRRFWNLLHYEDTKIPEWGNHVVKQCADSYLTSIPREILEQYFPKTS